MPGSSRSGRGGGWVAAQFTLFALIAATWFVGPGVTPLGLVVALAGVALAGWGTVALGRSMTPFPEPMENAELVERGPYRRLRHPVYVGGVLFFAGLSLVFSAWGLALTAVLAVFWAAKARLEERLLAERFPGYGEYRRRTWF